MRNCELKAFIFDLDGVIVNTIDLHFRAWKQIFDDLGISFNRREMDRFLGIHQREVLLSYADDLDETEIENYLARKNNYYKQMLGETREKILHEPVVNLLREAKARGLKIGLASSSTSAVYVLEIVRLKHLFDAIGDGGTVCRPKPAPDIFVWVAGALGLHPNEIIVIEDGIAGVQGARLAGMFVVGIEIPASSRPPHLNIPMSQLDYTEIASCYRLQTPSVSG